MKSDSWLHRFLHNQPLKHKLYVIIFESDTPAGKAFDVTLIICILLSILLAIIESLQGLPSWLSTPFIVLEYLFTVFFTFEYVILVVAIGTLMYMIEGTQPNTQFNNIPNSIYWAIVTMTTVGYGDITPATALGKFLSACVMLIGYTIIAVPTGIVSASMMKEYKKLKDLQCPNCHKTGHEENATYCKYCGHKLKNDEIYRQENTATDPDRTTS